MSSKAKKLEKTVENDKKLKLYTLYSTLAGSAIVSIGKLANKTEDFMLEDYAKLSTDEDFAKCKNIQEMCNFLIERYEMAECFRNSLVLIYDDENIYTPMISIMDEEGHILPLNREGEYNGILAQFGNKESINWENIYDD